MAKTRDGCGIGLQRDWRNGCCCAAYLQTIFSRFARGEGGGGGGGGGVVGGQDVCWLLCRQLSFCVYVNQKAISGVGSRPDAARCALCNASKTGPAGRPTDHVGLRYEGTGQRSLIVSPHPLHPVPSPPSTLLLLELGHAATPTGL